MSGWAIQSAFHESASSYRTLDRCPRHPQGRILLPIWCYDPNNDARDAELSLQYACRHSLACESATELYCAGWRGSRISDCASCAEPRACQALRTGITMAPQPLMSRLWNTCVAEGHRWSIGPPPGGGTRSSVPCPRKFLGPTLTTNKNAAPLRALPCKARRPRPLTLGLGAET